MLQLRPSVLQVGDSNSSINSNDQNKSQKNNDKVHTENMFKFAPLTKPSLSTSNGGSENRADLSQNTKTILGNESQEKGFLFGQNLEERVLLPTKGSQNVENKESDNNNQQELEPNVSTSDTNQLSQSLPEKRKYEAITGEEGESNVLQIFCKLYSWDSTAASWKEKGKGPLRLNDRMKDDKLCSRLVMRTAGSLRLILNASILVGMKFEISNEKCLRFTNIDGIYLVKGKEKDIEQMHTAIEYRLRELSKKVKGLAETSENSSNNVEESKINEPESPEKDSDKDSEKDDSFEQQDTSKNTEEKGSSQSDQD